MLRPSDESAAGAWPQRGRATILVVDDEPYVLRTVASILEPHGFAVLRASSGEEALQLFYRHGRKIDAVILDLVMPGMDGEEIFAELRRWNPEVRVLVSSGFAEHAAIPRITAHRGTGVLTKPYQPGELVLALDILVAAPRPTVRD